MTDLLIPDIDPDLSFLIEQRARTHDRNVYEEAGADPRRARRVRTRP